MSFTIDQNSINWARPTEDAKTGLTNRYCTFSAKDEDGNEQTYTVTVEYNKKNSGYAGDMDKAIKKVINATMDRFPKLVGTTMTFNLGSEDEDSTIINKHGNKDYEGKTLREIKDLDDDLYDDVKLVASEFFKVFKDMKKAPVDQEVSDNKKANSRVLDLDNDNDSYEIGTDDEVHSDEDDDDVPPPPKRPTQPASDDEDEFLPANFWDKD